MERKTYVIGLFISSLSQLLFFGLAFYHSDETGRSWILFHREHWIWALFLSSIGLMFIVLGVIADLKGVNGEERVPQKTPSRIKKPQKTEKEKASEQLEDIESESAILIPVCQFGITGSCSLRYDGKTECGKNGDVSCPLEKAPAIWEEEEFE